MTLSLDKARDAIGRDVAGPLGISVDEGAALIAAVAEQDMVAAIEELAIKRGFDPREFLLVSGGGAGGLHAARLARELGMREVLFPHAASVLCAYGTATGDIKFDFSVSRATSSKAFDFAAVRMALAALHAEGTAFLERMDVEPARRTLRFTVDAHYQGQVSHLSVDLDGDLATKDDLARLTAAFHAEHQRSYSVQAPDDTIEFVAWNVEAIGRTRDATHTTGAQTTAIRPIVAERHRSVFDHATVTAVEIGLIASDSLTPGDTFTGPTLVEDRLTSIFIPERCSATVTQDRDLLVAIDA